MPVGKPPIFNSPDEMQLKIDAYFELCDSKTIVKTFEDGSQVEVPYPDKYTLTGLALFLDFESRQSLYDYEAKEGYSYIIKKAKLKIENQVENETRVAKNPAGQIFVLKNMGWKDKQDIEMSGSLDLSQRLKDARERAKQR